jgi:membrane fusion protein (multidrug efflux system)
MVNELSNANSRKKHALIFWGTCCGIALIALFIWMGWIRYIAYTDDAYVEGNQVYVTPLKHGFITAIHTDDTFLVKKGDLLIEMDESDATIALSRAKENLAQTVRNVCQLFHQVFAYQAEIEVRKAEFIKCSQDYEHRIHVIDAGGVSLEDLEHATAALRASYYNEQMTKVRYMQSLSVVQGTSITSHPLVLAAADELRDAWLQHYRCKIYAPVDGLVAQRKIQVGMWVKAGDPLMSVIPLDQIWVNANFKETQMRHMRIGQRVKVTSDLYGDGVVFHGTIVGLPGAAGNAFSLLPPQNLSGNWIKIVQRLPVRVVLDHREMQRYPLRIGLSMEATVDLHDQEGNLIPTSSAGSPHYETGIFTIEERGDEQFIEEIIAQNMDLTLSPYFTEPLYMELGP